MITPDPLDGMSMRRHRAPPAHQEVSAPQASKGTQSCSLGVFIVGHKGGSAEMQANEKQMKIRNREDCSEV